MDVQTQVQRMLNELVEQGLERGVQVAAYLDGRLVVDAWAGVTAAHDGRPVVGETLFTVFSTTKGIAATAIHWLVERGRLDVDAPVSRYWPEFAANGKAAITLRQVLSHSAGVPQCPDGTGVAELADWEWMVSGIATLAPVWEPGTRTGYHALTIGHIVGEVARRVDGRPIAQIVQDEFAGPLGIPFYLGLPESLHGQVAELADGPPLADAPEPTALSLRAIPPAIQPLSATFNLPAIRQASIPAGGAITTARALARFYAALVGTGVDGQRLLSAEGVATASALQRDDDDVVLGRRLPKGLGYFLGEPRSAMSERVSAFGHPGHGGSIGFADPEHRFAFGLTKNLLVASLPGTSTAVQVARLVRAGLGIPER